MALMTPAYSLLMTILNNCVNVPSIYLDLSAEVVARLRQQVHPLSQSQNHGIELYEQAYIWSVVLLDFMYMN